MHGQSPSLPPELWNLSVVILLCGLIAWMIRLTRLMLTYLETRFAIQQNAVIHLEMLGPSLHVLRHASMWHFHQLLRTQLQTASTTMKRVRVPFEVIASSVKFVEATGAQRQSQMRLSVEVKSEMKCMVQVFWNVKASALEGVYQNITSPRMDWPMKRPYQLNDIVPTRAARAAIHAVRSLPGKIYDMDRARMHQLLDDDTSKIKSEVIPDSPKTGFCLDHLFAYDSFRSCSIMERRKDGGSNEYVTSVPSELFGDTGTNEAIESSVVATDCENESTPDSPPVDSSINELQYACIIVIGSIDFFENDKSGFGIKRQLSTSTSRLQEDKVLCQCIAIDFLPTPAKYRRVPVVVKKLHFTATDVFSSQEIFGRESSSGECVICLERPPTAILLPCRHLCVCSECLDEIDQCPICRSKFSTYVSQDNM